MILPAIALILVVACSIDVNPVQPEQQGCQMVFHATMGQQQTRTVRMEDGNILWSPGDVIRVFHGRKSALFTAQNSEPAASVDFAGSFPENDREEGPFYALYAANSEEAELTVVNVSFQGTPGTKESVSVLVPFEQVVPDNSFAPGSFPSVATAQGNDFYFENLCGGAVITVHRPDIRAIRIRGNKNEQICGYRSHYYHADPEDPAPTVIGTASPPNYTVSIKPADGLAFKPGVKYYVSLFPATLEEGLTITYLSDNQTGVFVTDKEITISRSQFGRLFNLDDRATWSEEAANCYVVKPGKTVRFPSRTLPPEFSSNSSGAQRTVQTKATPIVYTQKLSVLWESYGTSSKPSEGSVVKSVVFDDGNIAVTAGQHEGNAVVAMMVNNVVVWSWHIWVTNADLEALAQPYRNGVGTAMDRNLGALSADVGDVGALGLLYQWGRKDPFPGASAIDGRKMSATTLTWPNPIPSNMETGTVEYTIANPTVFVSPNSYNYDWYDTGNKSTDGTRWHKDKGIFDPCPQGWQVPADDFWESAFPGDLTVFNKETSPPWASWTINFKGADLRVLFGTDNRCWYPAAGSLSVFDYALSLSSVGSIGKYWSCSPSSSGYRATYLYFSDQQLSISSYSRANALSVRCVKYNP